MCGYGVCAVATRVLDTHAGVSTTGQSYVSSVTDLILFFSLLSSLELSNTKVYEPYIRALLGTAAHFFKVVVLELRTLLRKL